METKHSISRYATPDSTPVSSASATPRSPGSAAIDLGSFQRALQALATPDTRPEDIDTGLADLIAAAVEFGDGAGSPARLPKAFLGRLLSFTCRELAHLDHLQVAGWLCGMARGLRLDEMGSEGLSATVKMLLEAVKDSVQPSHLGAAVMGLRVGVTGLSFIESLHARGVLEGVVAAAGQMNAQQRFAAGCGLATRLSPDEHAIAGTMCRGACAEADADDLLLGVQAAALPWAPALSGDVAADDALALTQIAVHVPYALSEHCGQRLRESGSQALVPMVRVACAVLAYEPPRLASIDVADAAQDAQEALRKHLVERLRRQREDVLSVFDTARETKHGAAAKHPVQAMWVQLHGLYESFAHDVLAQARASGTAPLADSAAWQAFVHEELAWGDELARLMHADLPADLQTLARTAHEAMRGYLLGLDELPAERS